MSQQVHEVEVEQTPQVQTTEQKHPLDLEYDKSFGSPYKDVTTTAMIAIELLLLAALLTSSKWDDMADNAFIALVIALASSVGYRFMRLTLSSNKHRWQLIHDELPWCSILFRFFFFTALYYIAWLACCTAVYNTIAHVSVRAGDMFVLSAGITALVMMLFNMIFEFLSLKKQWAAKVKRVQSDTKTSEVNKT